MKALVIGGTGPTGPFIVEGLLKRGYEVAILHRGTHEADLPAEVEHIHCDPHFAETLERGLGSRQFDLMVAMYGRIRYVAEVVRGHTPRLIAIGGMPYRAQIEGFKRPQGCPVPLPENAPLLTDESMSKFTYLMTLTEQEVMAKHQAGHYAATIFRYPRIYGPRQLAPWEWSIMRRILDGRRQVIIPDNGLKLSSRGYAENMAHAVLLAVDNPQASAGQTYNVRDELVLSLREWVCLIAQIMGSELELVSLPFEVARPSRPYAGRAHHEVLDITKVRAELGYRDLVPVEEAMRRNVMWYLENRPAPGGEVEKLLGDPFNYAVEDEVIKAFRDFVAVARERASVAYHHRHPYPHPKRPDEG
jgi:nucleoside-diphosphate-sugar epimerase